MKYFILLSSHLCKIFVLEEENSAYLVYNRLSAMRFQNVYNGHKHNTFLGLRSCQEYFSRRSLQTKVQVYFGICLGNTQFL